MLFEPSNSLLIMVPFVVVFLLLCMYKFRDSDMNKNECTQLSLNFPDSNPGIYQDEGSISRRECARWFGAELWL